MTIETLIDGDTKYTVITFDNLDENKFEPITKEEKQQMKECVEYIMINKCELVWSNSIKLYNIFNGNTKRIKNFLTKIRYSINNDYQKKIRKIYENKYNMDYRIFDNFIINEFSIIKEEKL
jgi:hypothetical protein